MRESEPVVVGGYGVSGLETAGKVQHGVREPCTLAARQLGRRAVPPQLALRPVLLGVRG